MGPDDSDDRPRHLHGHRAGLLPPAHGARGGARHRTYPGRAGRGRDPLARPSGRACRSHRRRRFEGGRPEGRAIAPRASRLAPRGDPVNFLAATIPILIVVLAAVAAMLAEAIRQPGERMYIAGFGLIGLGGALLASYFLWDTDAVSFGVVRADNFALFINMILGIIGILTMVFSHDVVEREGLPAGEYYALTLFAISGMMLMAAATDLLVIFLALEVLSLAVYVLTGLRRSSAAGAEAAFKYFLLGAFSSAFFLYGIAFAFTIAESTRLDVIGTAIASGQNSTLALLAVGLLAVGFCFKVS